MSPHYRTRLAMVLFWFGLAIGGLALADSLHALPWTMPRIWYLSRPLCLMIGGMAFLLGCHWLLDKPPSKRRSDDHSEAGHEDDDDGPALLPGVRFTEVTLYTRPGCHLCDQVLELLEEHEEYLPEIDVVNIQHDSLLRQQYQHEIPVVEVDGQVRFRGRVERVWLRRLIAGTPPLD